VLEINNPSLVRACCSLEGLSVGDAFGERFFLHPDVAENIIAARAIPEAPWYYTDDTQMALSIVSILQEFGRIEQDSLASSFAQRYEMERGYGAAMHRLLRKIQDGELWHQLAPNLFSGQGSFGNGAAMRVAPVGAYFAEDLDLVVEQAAKSAEVTHTHSEAIAGAIAVAVAAAWAARLKDSNYLPTRVEFLNLVLPYIPESEVSSKISLARNLSANTSVQSAAAVLGNGTQISAQDTVPFALWCASGHLNNYEEAIWLTVSGLGDRDTTCAIVGGIVAIYTGIAGIPPAWLQARESLTGYLSEVI
jgi:ADP-ribosylglycohydrolase